MQVFNISFVYKNKLESWKSFDKFIIYFPNYKENLISNLRPESKQEPVKTEMGPPPSPASTCSDASSIASSASMPYSKFYVKCTLVKNKVQGRLGVFSFWFEATHTILNLFKQIIFPLVWFLYEALFKWKNNIYSVDYFSCFYCM